MRLSDPKHRTTLVILAALAARLAVCALQPALTYDGTYYLRQAARLAHLHYFFVGFPPGYPLAVLVLAAVVRDFVLSGRLVSLIAGTATVGLFHHWARRRLSPGFAFAGALVLALHPEMAIASAEVLSEPLYILAILAGIVLFEARRDAAAGAVFGYAFLIRPEALILLLGCALARAWDARVHTPQSGGPFRTLLRSVPWRLLGAGFVPVAVFAALASHAVGHFVISPKQGQLALDAQVLVRSAIWGKTMHAVFPVLLLPFAVYHGWKRDRLLLVPLAYLLLLPLYDIHIQPRLHLPALPFLCVLGLAWMAGLRKRARVVALVVTLAFLVAGTAPPIRNLFRIGIVPPHAKELGEILRPHLAFEDRVACRLPFVPYYAGAGFCRTTVGSYVTTMDSLVANGATHLLLLEHEVTGMLPQLRPLFEDAGFAAAEGRLAPLATVDAPDGPRALLYRLRQPVLSARATQVAAGEVTSVTWAESDLVYTKRDGTIVVGELENTAAATPAGLAGSRPLAQVTGARDVRAAAAGGRIVFVQADDTAAAVAELDLRTGAHVVHRSTAADDPASPAFIHDRILYVRRAGSGGLRALDPRTGRTLPVRLAGVTEAEARPLSVDARGDAVAITYVRHEQARAEQRLIAATTWPAAAEGDSVIVLAGRWATQVSLADDAICWTLDGERILVSVLIHERGADGQTTGRYVSLGVLEPGGRWRRLSYDLDLARRPALHRGAIAFLTGGGDLRTAPIQSADLRIPQVPVFTARREAKPQRDTR